MEQQWNNTKSYRDGLWTIEEAYKKYWMTNEILVMMEKWRLAKGNTP